MPTTAHPRVAVVLAAAAIDEQGRQWIEVLPTAEKARNGPHYFTVTRDDLEIYAEFIRANAGTIPVDYDHEGAVGGSTVAAGWFTGQAEVVDNGDDARLRAEVEWTPQARDEIESKRFKFISAEFSFAEREKKTGLWTKAKELLAATLTNRPFFRELAPVAADIVWGEGVGYMERARDIAEILNGDSLVWRYWVKEITDGLALVCEGEDDYWQVPYTVAADGDVQVSPSSDWKSLEQQFVPSAEEAAEATARLVKAFTGGTAARTERNTQMDAAKLASALGLPEDANEEAVLEAVTAAKQKADEAEIAAELVSVVTAAETDRISKLEADLAEERKLRVESDRKHVIDDAVSARRITPVQGKKLAEQIGDNIDGLKAVIATFEPRPAATGAGGSEPETDDEKAVAAVKARFESDLADDVDGADLVAKAERLLLEQGKPRGKYTADEFETALATINQQG